MVTATTRTATIENLRTAHLNERAHAPTCTDARPAAPLRMRWTHLVTADGVVLSMRWWDEDGAARAA
jgi:hypothetical protein